MMTTKPIVAVLKRRGFCEGRIITFSKSGYRRRHPKHFVVFNAKIFTQRALILRPADLDLSIDADKLTAAAREAGENLYVLCESHPHPFWEPGSLPMEQVLRSAIWWTRIHPADQDVFVPVDSVRPRQKRLRLNCIAGQWQGQPAYSVGCWENDEFYNQNMTGAAVEIVGRPPREFRVKKCLKGMELSNPPAFTRGRPAQPVFYQQSGPLEFVWFDCGFAIPAVLYDQVVRPLGKLDFTLHDEHEAIHIRRDGQVVGLVWPSFIGAPEVAANARRRLGLNPINRHSSDQPEPKRNGITGQNTINP